MASNWPRVQRAQVIPATSGDYWSLAQEYLDAGEPVVIRGLNHLPQWRSDRFRPEVFLPELERRGNLFVSQLENLSCSQMPLLQITTR